ELVAAKEKTVAGTPLGDTVGVTPDLNNPVANKEIRAVTSLADVQSDFNVFYVWKLTQICIPKPAPVPGGYVCEYEIAEGVALVGLDGKNINAFVDDRSISHSDPSRVGNTTA